MRVVYWGTYDTGKPRNRIMLQGLRLNGVEVIECHKDIWHGVEDKSQVTGWLKKITIIVRWLLSYPSLIVRYMRLPQHDCVVVGYMGHLDVLVLWPFAKLRGVPVVWDAFLSLYNTVVEDRKLVSSCNPIALFLYCLEWLVSRLAHFIVLDTNAHKKYFVEKYNLSENKVGRVFVGAEACFFVAPKRSDLTVVEEKLKRQGYFNVLFYGQFIPLHGIEYIISAARLTQNENIAWIVIGKGQEKANIDTLIKKYQLANVVCYEWVPYGQLVAWISLADVCLGIFGNTEKAQRVIPNKVYQILAAGKFLITGDTPAIRELDVYGDDSIKLVPLASPQSIADAVLYFKKNKIHITKHVFSSIAAVSPEQVGGGLKAILQQQLEYDELLQS